MICAAALGMTPLMIFRSVIRHKVYKRLYHGDYVHVRTTANNSLGSVRNVRLTTIF